MRQTKGQEISIVTICLGVYFMLMVFDSIPMFGIGSILKFMVLLPVGAIVCIKLRSEVEINAQIVLFVLYLFFLACSYLYSINRAETFIQLKRVVLNAAVIICAGGMYDYNAREVDILKKSLMVGGVLTLLLTMFLADFSAGGRLTLSINGTVQDQNYLNGYLFYAYSYFFCGVVDRKKPWMAVPVGGILFFTLMTGSRGALLALAGISMVIVICVMLKEKRIRLSTFVIVVVGILLLVALYRPILMLLPEEVAVRFTPDYIEEHGSTGRAAIWSYLLNRFVHASVFRTLFGYGFGTVAYLNEYNHLVAHNMWIEHLLAVGVVGEILFISMQIAFFRAAWKTGDVFIISAYAGYLVMMMSLTLLSYKPIWNCMMMILIIARTYRMQSETEHGGENNGKHPIEA